MDFVKIPLRICTAEDLVVMKAFANRPRDWSDIQGIVIRQTGKLDTAYILKQLTPLTEAKQGEPILSRLEDVLNCWVST